MRKAFIALALGVMLAISCAGHATARAEDGWTAVYEGDIDLADSVDCTIPAGASIKVTAMSVEGNNGNVTFRVITP